MFASRAVFSGEKPGASDGGAFLKTDAIRARLPDDREWK
jgi:hypothetical protein